MFSLVPLWPHTNASTGKFPATCMWQSHNAGFLCRAHSTLCPPTSRASGSHLSSSCCCSEGPDHPSPRVPTPQSLHSLTPVSQPSSLYASLAPVTSQREGREALSAVSAPVESRPWQPRPRQLVFSYQTDFLHHHHHFCTSDLHTDTPPARSLSPDSSCSSLPPPLLPQSPQLDVLPPHLSPGTPPSYQVSPHPSVPRYPHRGREPLQCLPCPQWRASISVPSGTAQASFADS